MKTSFKRPTRQKKSDRMIIQGATAEEQAVHMALGPFDRKVIETDRQWGVDALPELVEPEMAAKYGQALAKLNAAIEANDAEKVVTYVGVCIRGLEAMEKAALAAGKTPVSDECWIVEADGQSFGIMRDGRAWRRVQEQLPDVELVTDREIALALAYYRNSVAGQVVSAVKQAWPSAEVTKYGKKGDDLNDPIPF